MRGWAYDPDDPSASLTIHVYVGGDAASGERHVITANVSRPDVNSAYGITGNHGFDATFNTSKTGSQPVVVYMINTPASNINPPLPEKYVNITSGDAEKPVISDVHIVDVTDSSYTVTCNVSDNVGVVRAIFPTWTNVNDQDDLIWHEGTVSGGRASCTINFSDHGNQTGCTYITHVYAYDAAGNSTITPAYLEVGSEMQSGYDRVLPDGDYVIALASTLAGSPWCFLDIYGTAYPAESGTNVSICSTSDDPTTIVESDTWSIAYNDGFYTISQKGTNVVLDVKRIGMASGTNVQACNGNGGANQQWAISKNGDGYRVECRCNGLSLENSSNILSTGNNVWVATDTSTEAQQWSFIPRNRDIAKATVSSVEDQDYTGEEVTPKPTLTWGDATLIEGVDYEVSYKDNVEPGTATVTIVGIGSYTGTTSTTFEIVGGDPDLSHDGWVDLPRGAKGYARNGALVRGWFDLGDAKYWFDDSGRMAVGWTDLEVSGKTMHYYFHPSGNLARSTWATIDGANYYFRPSGNMATGWATISDNGVDKKYWFDEGGQMVTGWRDIANDGGVTNRYYFRPSGSMATEWATIDGVSYYFRPSGNMATGFADVVSDSYKRYFDERGHMLAGWQEIGGNTYYFRPSGAMQTGTATIGGIEYAFSDKGVFSGSVEWVRASDAPEGAPVLARKWEWDVSVYRSEVSSYTYYRWCSNYDGIWNQDSCSVNGTSAYHEVTVASPMASQANRFEDQGGNAAGICGPYGSCEHKVEGQSFWWLKSVNYVDVLDHTDHVEGADEPSGDDVSNVVEWVRCPLT